MRRIGRYALLTRLASGDRADIFLARFLETLPPGKKTEGGPASLDLCVVKLLRADVARSGQFGKRLISSGKDAESLSHQNVVPVFEVAESQSDLFIAMALIQGQNLATVLKRASSWSGMQSALVLWIFAEVAAGLEAMHRQGSNGAALVHGGVCPSAVMVGYDGQVQLLGAAEGPSRLSVAPHRSRLYYTAPELLVQRTADHRADVYSLAVSLLEALTDQRVFKRNTDLETRQAILQDGPLPVSSWLAGHDPRLVDLVETALAKDPDRRLPSAQKFEDALRGLSGSDAAQARARLQLFLDEAFESERDAQKRVVENAVRKANELSTGPQVVRARRERKAIPAVDRPQPPLLSESALEAPTPRPRLEILDHTTEDLLERRTSPGTGAFFSAPRVLSPEATDPGLALEVQGTELREQADVVSPPTAPRPDLPLTIGRYQPEAILSRHERTTVFRAFDPLIARKVALKCLELPDEPERDSELALLWREARLLGLAPSGRFPLLLDAGIDRTSAFLVLELIDGETLRSLLGRHVALPESLIRCVFLDVVKALAQCHRAGLLHGDVRPSNILVSRDGARAWLCDLSLGLAADEEEHPRRGSNLPYLAPENLEGEEYSARSEQFALGVVAYQMLVGAAPFRGADDRTLRAALLSDEPRPPEAMMVGVDPRLSEITMRLLEKDPALRFLDLDQLAGQLADRGAGSVEITERARIPQLSRPPMGARLDPVTLALCLAALLDRAPSGLGTVSEASELDRPSDMARAIARSLKLDERAEMLVALAVAGRGLLDRLGTSADVEDLAAYLPHEAGILMRESELVFDAAKADLVASPLAEIVALVEAYHRATRAGAEGQRASPRKAVLQLRERADRKEVSSAVVEAMVDYVRELISALEIPPRDERPKRILLVAPADGPTFEDLTRAGFELLRAPDLESAAKKLAFDRFDGAIIDGAFAGQVGRDVLLKIRADRRTAALPVLMLCGRDDQGLLGPLDPTQPTELLPAPLDFATLLEALQRLLKAPIPIDRAP